jgi:hypothetical protein
MTALPTLPDHNSSNMAVVRSSIHAIYLPGWAWYMVKKNPAITSLFVPFLVDNFYNR